MPRLRWCGGTDTPLRGIEHDAAADLDAAGIGSLEAGDAPQRRRLAAARGPEQADELAVGGDEAHVVDDELVAEALAEPIDPDAHARCHVRDPHAARNTWRDTSAMTATMMRVETTDRALALPQLAFSKKVQIEIETTRRLRGVEQHGGGDLAEVGDEQQEVGALQRWPQQRQHHARERLQAVGAGRPGGLLEALVDLRDLGADRLGGVGHEAGDVAEDQHPQRAVDRQVDVRPQEAQADDDAGHAEGQGGEQIEQAMALAGAGGASNRR